ncbi:odorant receptor 13a-like [Xylocopa sonorina]|uniref:odorant receptor 13a-like n=1 Tax=Xylocopa sonorina TaxID=1818115 RepID=UPI00403ADAAE
MISWKKSISKLITITRNIVRTLIYFTFLILSFHLREEKTFSINKLLELRGNEVTRQSCPINAINYLTNEREMSPIDDHLGKPYQDRPCVLPYNVKKTFIWSFDRETCVDMSRADFDQGLRVGLGWNRRNMDLVGIWPEPSCTGERCSDIKTLFYLAVIILFGPVPQSTNLFFVWDDLELVTENLSTANIPGINAAIKLFIAWRHRKSFKPIVKSFYDDWRGPKTEEERAVMFDRAKSARFISVWCSVLTLSMVTVYLSLRAIIIYQSNRLNESQDRLVLYPGYFPYNVRPVPVLVLTNLGQVVAAYSAVICYTTVDTFIAMLVMHLCGQFQILRKKTQKLMGDERGSRSADEIQKELTWIVKRHEHLNCLKHLYSSKDAYPLVLYHSCTSMFAIKIEDCFSVLLLIQMLLCTIEICFQGFLFFNVILRSEEGILSLQFVFFILFVCFIVVHLYIYCYIGEMLLVQSKELGNSAYESNWFNVSPQEAKYILFIMHRSNRPLSLTAGKFSTFSMEMFSTILKTAMGYLSFLLTVAAGE